MLYDAPLTPRHWTRSHKHDVYLCIKEFIHGQTVHLQLHS